VDIYSGRENPSWDLSESDARQLVNRVVGKAVAAVNEVEGVLGVAATSFRWLTMPKFPNSL
jgi:hypothetical protein